MVKMRKGVYASCALAAILSGCASIVSPTSYMVSLTSNVQNAKVTIYNRENLVGVFDAPTEVRLSPKSGFYVPAKYRFVFEKAGWAGDEVALDADFNWWFASNILFTPSFVIGIFLDPATGAMWKLNNTSVVGTLKPLSPQPDQVEDRWWDDVPSWIFQCGGGSELKKRPPQNVESVEVEQISL